MILLRLDKMLAHMGFGTRKQVRELIRKGNVRRNGIPIKQHGAKIDVEKDTITVNGEIIEYRKYIYLMLNKPQGVISATFDHYDQTVIDLLPFEYVHFEPFPVGRLDKDTEGLLLLTNDGKVSHLLTSPNRAIEKTYYAKIFGEVTIDHTKEFKRGVTLDDGYVTKPGELTILTSGLTSEIELTITEGKFHQVKRMFKAIGLQVFYLQRIKMGEIDLDTTLSLGEVRELNEMELAYIKDLKQE